MCLISIEGALRAHNYNLSQPCSAMRRPRLADLSLITTWTLIGRETSEMTAIFYVHSKDDVTLLAHRRPQTSFSAGKSSAQI
jgi:hypothetical protein